MYDAKRGMMDSGYQPGAGDGDHGGPVRRIGSGAFFFCGDVGRYFCV